MSLSVCLQIIPGCCITICLFADYHSIQTDLSERLEKALGTCAPLLRDIFLDFAPYLTKTLLGTKGQELLIGGTRAQYGYDFQTTQALKWWFSE